MERRYGERGPWVVLIHGGPGAPGSLAPLARELARDHRVVEHLQPSWSEGGRSVADHLADLERCLAGLGASATPALVGHSWGAMLALCCAAEVARPSAARAAAGEEAREASLRLTARPLGPVVLVGSGTFDLESRAEQRRRREALPPTPALAARIARLRARVAADPDDAGAFGELGSLLSELELVDPLPHAADFEVIRFDRRGNQSAWSDMLRLQEEGVYPARFARIRSKVTLIQGAQDTHPGRLIRASLESALPELDYVELERCGHYPWLERQAREPFLTALRAALSAG